MRLTVLWRVKLFKCSFNEYYCNSKTFIDFVRYLYIEWKTIANINERNHSDSKQEFQSHQAPNYYLKDNRGVEQYK